jgi:hypothetical protein
MIDIKMKYQATIFVDASNIIPTPDNTKTLIDLFSDKELIPNTFREISSSSPVPLVRLSLASSTNEWVINFASRRIDIERHPIEPQGRNLGELSEFCSEVTNFFERIVKTFKKKANRLALVTNFLLEEMTDSNLARVYLKLFNPPKFYEETQPFEWNWRSVSRRPIDLEELTEALNVITMINRVSGEFVIKDEVALFNRIQLSFDINTTSENREHRFDFCHITNFYDSVLKFHNDLLMEIMEFINE